MRTQGLEEALRQDTQVRRRPSGPKHLRTHVQSMSIALHKRCLCSQRLDLGAHLSVR